MHAATVPSGGGRRHAAALRPRTHEHRHATNQGRGGTQQARDGLGRGGAGAQDRHLPAGSRRHRGQEHLGEHLAGAARAGDPQGGIPLRVAE